MDDDPPIRTWLRHILEGRGYQVQEASDGEEALATLERLEPALVVLDLFMPKVDGLEGILYLQSCAKPVKILAISADPVDGYDVSRTAKLFGANDTLTKPFGGATFLQHIRALLSNP